MRAQYDGNNEARYLIQFERLFILLLAIIFLVGTILSLYHLGIEQGFIQESLVLYSSNYRDSFSDC